jgi:hypothetical protein
MIRTDVLMPSVPVRPFTDLVDFNLSQVEESQAPICHNRGQCYVAAIKAKKKRRVRQKEQLGENTKNTRFPG